MLNQAQIIGNLGADPESNTTHDGGTVCRLSIATSHVYTSGATGERVEETEWHRVTVFGRSAAACAQYLTKGRQVYVQGRLRTSKWTDKDKIDRWSTEIIADKVQFLGAKS